MVGTILLVGGWGKTSRRIATRLQAQNVPVLIASRSAETAIPAEVKASGQVKGVRFDWTDESTFVNPFNQSTIETIYIIPPNPSSKPEVLASAKRFIDLAKDKGVNRFVILTGAEAEKGGKLPECSELDKFFKSFGINGIISGQIQEYLDQVGVDWAAVRPTWFMGNFLEMVFGDEIITAAGDGKMGFVSEDDIADLAVQLLLAPKLGGADPRIVGPELLSYSDAADILSQVVNRKITHRAVSVSEREQLLTQFGVPQEVAGFLARLEGSTATGHLERCYDEWTDKVVGKVRFREFAEANKAAWAK